jgi:UDP-glucuronate 4-epimerase
MEFVQTLEKAIGINAKKEFVDMQPGDVVATYADIDDLIKDVGFKPSTLLETGINNFVQWYKDYYKC